MQLLPCLLALLCWGLWGFFPKLAVRDLGQPFSAAVFQYAGTVLCFSTVVLVALVAQRLSPSLLSSLGIDGLRLVWRPRGAAYAAIAGTCGAVGGIFYQMAAARMEISVVVVLTALYPVVTVLVAWLALGEHLAPRQWVGLALAVVAVVLVTPR